MKLSKLILLSFNLLTMTAILQASDPDAAASSSHTSPAVEYHIFAATYRRSASGKFYKDDIIIDKKEFLSVEEIVKRVDSINEKASTFARELEKLAETHNKAAAVALKELLDTTRVYILPELYQYFQIEIANCRSLKRAEQLSLRITNAFYFARRNRKNNQSY
jgi:hypothetical protein